MLNQIQSIQYIENMLSLYRLLSKTATDLFSKSKALKCVTEFSLCYKALNN